MKKLWIHRFEHTKSFLAHAMKIHFTWSFDEQQADPIHHFWNTESFKDELRDLLEIARKQEAGDGMGTESNLLDNERPVSDRDNSRNDNTGNNSNGSIHKVATEGEYNCPDCGADVSGSPRYSCPRCRKERKV